MLRRVLLLACWFVPIVPAMAQPPERVVTARSGMVVCVSPEAAEIGAAILRKGGSAVDASVGVALAMAVTYPAAGNIGGGGFMLIAVPGKEPTVIDYRETAPAAVNRDTFLATTNWRDHRACGVPGTLRGLELAHRKFGVLPWKELVESAVKLAEEGFELDGSMVKSLNDAMKSKGGNEEFRRIFGKEEGWKIGDRLVQKDLGATLKRIAIGGASVFYIGAVAEQLVAEMEAGGGYISLEDLKSYQARERKPIHGTYRGFDVYAPPPPSSGGIALVQMLNVLENFDLRKMGSGTTASTHLLAETMRRAYVDRARYLGDPDFTKIPEHLTTKEYAGKLARSIDLNRATPSIDLAEGIPLTEEKDSTTHFSVVDAAGMAVSNTYTLEDSYGSRVVVRGGGYILNNEMEDFNSRPGVTTTKGRIGTEPNVVAPGKRMLSSQCPTIIRRDGKLVLVTGSPGGRTIINTVLCVVTNVIDHEMEIQAAVDSSRVHHQWFPDVLSLESRNADLVKRLEELGHKVRRVSQGDAHSIWVDAKDGLLHGAADRRINGKAVGFSR